MRCLVMAAAQGAIGLQNGQHLRFKIHYLRIAGRAGVDVCGVAGVCNVGGKRLVFAAR